MTDTIDCGLYWVAAFQERVTRHGERVESRKDLELSADASEGQPWLSRTPALTVRSPAAHPDMLRQRYRVMLVPEPKL